LYGAGIGKFNECRSWRGLNFKKYKILNRVSTEVFEIPKAEHTMKITHLALDAV
jgi:hypothetical protein